VLTCCVRGSTEVRGTRGRTLMPNSLQSCHNSVSACLHCTTQGLDISALPLISSRGARVLTTLDRPPSVYKYVEQRDLEARALYTDQPLLRLREGLVTGA
jgi:hypothetical protein